MSFKPLSCHLSPDDSHSLSGSHLNVYHAAITWIVSATFIMAPSTVMSAEAIILLGRWCIGEEIKSGTRIWVNKRGRLTVQGSSIYRSSRNQLMIFLPAVAGCSLWPREAEIGRNRQL